MKKILRNFKTIPLKNNFTIFIILLIMYYLVNLLTSSANSGMSGQLLAESNPYNRLMAGLIITFLVCVTVGGRTHCKNFSYRYMKLFIIYALMSFLICLLCDYRFYISQINSSLYVVYWMLTYVFCVQSLPKLERDKSDLLIRIIVIVYLAFIIYKMSVQKNILTVEGIVGGINVAGSVYMIAPLILLSFHNKWRIIVFCVCFFVCILSAKRQAALGMFIMSIFEMSNLVKNFWRNFRFKGVVIVFVALFCFSNTILSSFDDLIARQERIEEVNGSIDSGRSDLRRAALTGYANANVMAQLFGGGVGSGGLYIKEYYGKFNYPHCGFIEILCDYGIVGFMCFIMFLYSLMIQSFRMKNKEFRLIGISCVAALVFISSISHIGNMNLLYISTALGYIFTYKQ